MSTSKMASVTVVMQKKKKKKRINLLDSDINKHVFPFVSTKCLTNGFGQHSIEEGKGRRRMRHYYTTFVARIPNAT